jgi:2-dehydro-3-deoxyglucarate aldolase/4-hydroxy-2-oxoheptanedioate aldolase
MQSKPAFWLESDHQKACEIAKLAGYQVVVFDMEHGVLDKTVLDRLVPYCNGIGLETYVRVSEPTRLPIQLALDIGAKGVILPQIADLAHAAVATTYSKYPPLGTRGLGYSRTQEYGAATDDFIDTENATRRCYVMIETATALQDVTAIAGLDCVDGLFVGPGDLSLTRGRGVFGARLADIEDMRAIAAAAKAAGKVWAVAAGHAGYRQAALALSPEFATSADDLSALVMGFRGMLEAHEQR